MADEPEFSPEALRKQAEYDRLKAAGEPIPWSLMAGIYEPATKPTEAERCRHCGADARPTTMFGGDGEFCDLCITRGHDKDYRRTPCSRNEDCIAGDHHEGECRFPSWFGEEDEQLPEEEVTDG